MPGRSTYATGDHGGSRSAPSPPAQRIHRVGARRTPTTFVHGAGARLDYGWQWNLGDDTIARATITVTGDRDQRLTASGKHEAGGLVSVWLAGGVTGTDYTVVCRIRTVQGREDEASLRVLCRAR